MNRIVQTSTAIMQSLLGPAANMVPQLLGGFGPVTQMLDEILSEPRRTRPR